MNYLTNYYKNRCAQLQEQANRLSQKIRFLSEDPGDSAAGEAQERPENPWMTPEWAAPEFNPNLPQSPVRPPNEEEWERNNPFPNSQNYPNNEQGNADYNRDVDLWYAARDRAQANYNAWFRYQVGINRISGRGKDKEWTLPRFRVTPRGIDPNERSPGDFGEPY